jgi:heat shock protein HslJ
MRHALFAASILALTACTGAGADEAVPPDYLAIEWKLIALDGAPFPAQATIDFSQPGRVSGQAPCNRWFAGQTAPLPQFAVAAVGATRMACPDLAAEAAFFEALATMTRAEVTGPVNLTLTGDKGRSMEFVRPLN